MPQKQKILFFDYELTLSTHPGMSDILLKLAREHELYLVSDQENIGASLDKAGLRKCFLDVFEKERLGRVPKSDQWFFLTPIDELNLEKEKVLVIAHSVDGINGAKKAGLPVIACTWGEQERELLIGAKPDYLADHPKELLSVLQSINLA